ncbi:MAG TPA: PucR family transcriptional regulator ligand-binding domain-containing protein [Halanaerobiales bacterium]|nr:PucR family transcriptional regulator ligand-binding domain-containing protein [Halanaerobiales bacterium]
MKELIGITMADALNLEKMKEVKVLAGEKGLDRHITKVNIMEVPDIVDWVKEGELLFTTLYSIKDDEEALKNLVPNLAKKNLAGLGIKPGRYINEIPSFMIEQAEKHNFPLLKIPYDFSFSEFINPILSEILNVQTRFLEKTLNIHEVLTNTVLYENGLDRLSTVLVDMIKNPVLITDSNVTLMSYSIPDEFSNEITKKDLMDTVTINGERETEEEIYGYRCKKKQVSLNEKEMNLIKIPIITPNNHFGYLFAWEYDKNINKLDLSTLKWASTIAALDILNTRALTNVELKYKNELIYDILKGKLNNKQTIVNRGQNMGMELDNGFSVVVFELKELISKHFKNKGILNENLQKTYLESAKRLVDDDIIMGDLGTYLIALYPGEEKNKDEIEEFAQRVLNVIDKKDRDLVTIGVGNYKEDIINLYESYSQAKRTINVASKLDKEDQIYFFEDLGVYKLLYKIDTEEKNSFLENSIIPLLKYDRAHNTELLKTLKAFFEENGNLTNVAKKIYIHYNTVHYRLKRIEKITGLSLENPDDKLNLEIALKMLNFTDILGGENA